jgi:hypothetical protein
MRIPVWLTLAVAAIVAGFGLYRLYLAFRKPGELTQTPKRGFYAMGKRAHLMIGILYVLLGIGLFATSFGWNPFGGLIGPSTEQPKAGEEPTKGQLPIDQLPDKKQ